MSTHNNSNKYKETAVQYYYLVEDKSQDFQMFQTKFDVLGSKFGFE